MKRLTTIVAVATMLCSGSAWAKDYGDAGTIDLTGNVGFEQRTTKLTETETDVDTTDDTSTSIEVFPEVAFFLLPGLAVLGGVELSQSSDKDNLDDSESTDQRIAVRAGGAYLLGIGTARIGPALRVGFIQGSSKFEDDEDTYSGPSLQLGGLMKLPIGSGGVITASLLLEQNMLKYDYDPGEADVTETGFALTTGVGIYF